MQNDETATLRGPIQILHSTFCILHLRWSARQDLHLRSLGSRPSMLLLHHALFAPVRMEHTGDLFSWGMRDPHTLNLCPAVRIENWRTRRELHPQPSRRQRVAPLIELRVQKWPAIRSPPAV